MADNTAAVQVSGASKRFGSLVALDDISLEIGTGENFGIIAPMARARRRSSISSPACCHPTRAPSAR